MLSENVPLLFFNPSIREIGMFYYIIISIPAKFQAIILYNYFNYIINKKSCQALLIMKLYLTKVFNKYIRLCIIGKNILPH